MSELIIETKNKKEIIDITEHINDLLKKEEKETGLIFLFVLHTTCALTTADLDPGAEKDYLTAFEEITPKKNFVHPHNPNHFSDHFLSSLVGTQLILPFKDKNLILGTWQRIILIEFNGPKKRNIYLKII
ncbi:MAG: hypothetical protein KatS3mg095_0630 [Candidatus Parcubacteria bacterium]|nr:MAG: hypothetical protein KatS3mg095_0630 [Candidatus Parcubacteria bacterium]